MYETTDKRIKLGSLQVDPRPYLYYRVGKGSLYETIRSRVRDETIVATETITVVLTIEGSESSVQQ